MAKRFGFTYVFCNDLEAMKKFYSDVLHLALVWEDPTSIAYKVANHQLSITFDAGFNPPSAEYAIQPGWPGGTALRISWSLECDRENFLRIVQAAKATGAQFRQPEPKWVGYWSFPLLDPMNNTIEITCIDRTALRVP